jgi:hypothetical protein
MKKIQFILAFASLACPRSIIKIFETQACRKTQSIAHFANALPQTLLSGLGVLRHALLYKSDGIEQE